MPRGCHGQDCPILHAAHYRPERRRFLADTANACEDAFRGPETDCEGINELIYQDVVDVHTSFCNDWVPRTTNVGCLEGGVEKVRGLVSI